MRVKAIFVAAVGVIAIAVAGVARADWSLLDFQQAVDALHAVDPTIPAPRNDPRTDFAVGGFQGQDGNNVGFSAQSGPQGQNPKGRLSETIPQTHKGRFTVTCLAVAGSDAAVGLHPTDAASNDETDEFVLVVHNGAVPGGAADQYGFSNQPADTCPAALELANLGFPLRHGNLNVHDG